MSLREKISWKGNVSLRLEAVKKKQSEISSGQARRLHYYFFTGDAYCYAIECYLEKDGTKESRDAAKLVVEATLLYFYGKWRETLLTDDGKIGQAEWKTHCLWYDEVMQALPFAAALSDWESVKRIAAYPAEDAEHNPVREASKATGEGAWGWGLIMFLRNESRAKVEDFLRRAESDKAKRPKLLCPILRALMDNDSHQFEKTLLAYLSYYRKTEFKLILTKVVALDGMTLYHLGRRQGFNITLPENVADHVIRFEE